MGFNHPCGGAGNKSERPQIASAGDNGLAWIFATCTMALSPMETFLPIRIMFTSPRTLAPYLGGRRVRLRLRRRLKWRRRRRAEEKGFQEAYQMEELAPTSTSPMTLAVGATNTVVSTFGVLSCSPEESDAKPG